MAAPSVRTIKLSFEIIRFALHSKSYHSAGRNSDHYFYHFCRPHIRITRIRQTNGRIPGNRMTSDSLFLPLSSNYFPFSHAFSLLFSLPRMLQKIKRLMQKPIYAFSYITHYIDTILSLIRNDYRRGLC
jgi:hypothetical protein